MTATTLRWLALASVVALAAACAGKDPGGGPNYSTLPCAETCGQDRACMNRCTPVTTTTQQPLPAGLQPGK
ncbi:MAG: hypothetical protein IPG50_16270 [Myxococcales bacterium]|nr:hypothetical protein [Myxococcales bacterium]